MEDREKIIVVKPVATRPRSSFRSFATLPVSANVSSPSTSIEGTTVSIKPKAVRFKPSLNQSPSELVSSMDMESESAVSNLFHKALTSSRENYRSSVIYKPTGKVVSRTAASLFGNLANDISHQQALEVQGQVQVSDPNIKNQPTFGLHHNITTQKDVSETYEPHIYKPSVLVPLIMEQDMVTQRQTGSGDRAHYDGYNWRKYGQKHVKGSGHPRSYYKCIHPNCPVKKKVEVSFDQQISEIIYKGEHNHSKPQPTKHLSCGSEGRTFVSDSLGSGSDCHVHTDHHIERNISDSRMDIYNGVSCLATPYPRKVHYFLDSLVDTVYNSCVGNPETSFGLCGDSDVGSREAVVDNDNNDKAEFKRRKSEDPVSRTGTSTRGIAESHFAQTSTELDASGDGFRWRKYGQKVVKGNSYPRCYYRCTSLQCNMRKYVERALDNPAAFITTYEGEHNHDMQDTKVCKSKMVIRLTK